MWEQVKFLEDNYPRWLNNKIMHQCRHFSWTKAVQYTKSNKNGILTYKLGQVQRHLLNKHKDLDCCQAFFMKNQINVDEKKQKIQATMAAAYMDESSSNQRNLRSVCLS